MVGYWYSDISELLKMTFNAELTPAGIRQSYSSLKWITEFFRAETGLRELPSHFMPSLPGALRHPFAFIPLAAIELLEAVLALQEPAEAVALFVAAGGAAALQEISARWKRNPDNIQENSQRALDRLIARAQELGFVVDGYAIIFRVSAPLRMLPPPRSPPAPAGSLGMLTCSKTFAAAVHTQAEDVFPALCAASADGDVVLRCAGDYPVRAHRSLLSLASPVLRDMLDTAAATQAAPTLELPCAADSPAAWLKALALMYPLGARAERALAWLGLEALLRLADKCAPCSHDALPMNDALPLPRSRSAF
jgi:hypothetical protein